MGLSFDEMMEQHAMNFDAQKGILICLAKKAYGNHTFRKDVIPYLYPETEKENDHGFHWPFG